MLSTGEVMGISTDFGTAYAKAQMSIGNTLPIKGNVLLSVKDSDKPRAIEVAAELHKLGFKITATKGTCLELIKNNIPSEFALKMAEGRPNIVDSIINGKFSLIINTTIGKQAITDSYSIRRNALDKQIPYVTTIRGAAAVAEAIKSIKSKKVGVKAIQLYNK
jgi:carbamoyl-phosphate synthase large subunit